MNHVLEELKVFEHTDFGEVRTAKDEQGQILFSGNDVAHALGYSNSRDALRRHCRAVVKHDAPISGKIQEINYIYEPDLYRLMVKSKLPAAVAFEAWVFNEVLPALRKYGIYASDELLSSEQRLAEATTQLKAEKEKRHKLQETNRTLRVSLEEQRSHAEYAQAILCSDLDMTATQIAADYGISAIRLNNLLHDAGLQRKVNGQWVLYKRYMNLGLTTSHTAAHEVHGHCHVQTRWTQEGRLAIHRVMEKAGIAPIDKNTTR